eukprot:3506989-Pyramimonas_sp.AAC.1
MSSSADVDLPALLSADFSQAFPSLAHEWMLMVLGALHLHPPLYGFIAYIYSNVICWAILGGPMVYLFGVGSGIIQGCPGSGLLYAVTTDCFLLDCQKHIDLKRRGEGKACADDIGATIKRL